MHIPEFRSFEQYYFRPLFLRVVEYPMQLDTNRSLSVVAGNSSRVGQPAQNEDGPRAEVAQEKEKRMVGFELARIGIAQPAAGADGGGGVGFGSGLIDPDADILGDVIEGERLFGRAEPAKVGFTSLERQGHAELGQQILELVVGGDREPREADRHRFRLELSEPLCQGPGGEVFLELRQAAGLAR